MGICSGIVGSNPVLYADYLSVSLSKDVFFFFVSNTINRSPVL